MIDLQRLRPEDALYFFRSKGLAPPDARFDFRDVWRNEHASNFVVAKAMRTDVLETIRGALDRALANGGTLGSFMDDLEPELKRLGWWGSATERDPLTGELKNVQLGSPRRLRVIFDANMRAAHAAGKWARIQRTKNAFPFLRYVQIQRDTKREDHARYHDLILPVDHPAWLRIFPPNGWRCGCTVQQLSQGMIDRGGLKVTEDFELEERGVLNRRTGEIEPTALGVDPAWDSNAGHAWLDLGARHAGISTGLSAPAAATELGFAMRARLMGLGDGREHLGAFNLRTGEEIDWSVGGADRVRLGPEVTQRLRDGQEIGLVHNHPSSAPLSPQDLATMFERRVTSILAVGHDGSLYMAVRLSSARANAVGFQEVAGEMLDEIAPDLDRADRDHAIRLIVLEVLRAQGLILYSDSSGARALEVRQRVRGTVAEVVRAITEMLEE
ncbi:prophage MuSo2, F protein, putative [Roseovarius sp. TM1035]|uniref:phage head morphogenesis protein n=1 Tax=Roseovarius sp. TM1035 TaxID=391613 RepID=UPI0001556AF8|nr:phage minor head protein [Roseovarius sp. TM1035]AWZ21091.1 Phage (Mu-like) virion morphogenesis protein [Roseovarius sp. AK1035]EDM32971.1 prophage MuSo2, F protein, putative [Roseovarius sp. TM1035]